MFDNTLCSHAFSTIPLDSQSASALGSSMFDKTLALSQGFRVNAFSKRLKNLAQF